MTTIGGVTVDGVGETLEEAWERMTEQWDGEQEEGREEAGVEEDEEEEEEKEGVGGPPVFVRWGGERIGWREGIE